MKIRDNGQSYEVAVDGMDIRDVIVRNRTKINEIPTPRCRPQRTQDQGDPVVARNEGETRPPQAEGETDRPADNTRQRKKKGEKQPERFSRRIRERQEQKHEVNVCQMLEQFAEEIAQDKRRLIFRLMQRRPGSTKLTDHKGEIPRPFQLWQTRIESPPLTTPPGGGM